ncbi:MAG: Asp-tRNA(Asn)/Glu-tRNA(Gln) amidotransferase subunit GatA [Lentisphaeria bacterium]|nr:Asp-tRNA(Asn)/Glu-tRNA(Gln) amidotransferase subunit GatA [Lentisphaeria bacterium]
MSILPKTLHEAADALAAGSTTSLALCQGAIDRIAAVDPKVKAILSLDCEGVLQAAAESDERRANGSALGRFDGVPVALKDNMAQNGQPCTCASRILEHFVSPYNATVVQRLLDRGFVLCGRTNLDEFAMGSSTENSAFQRTANPWNLECVPGGSSGGSAAAVAAGEVPAALGSDTGGSIRQPASFCGVVGLKPSYGRVSRYGLVAYASSLDQIGPLTNNVRDAAILLDAIGGHDPLDSTSLNLPMEQFETTLADASPKGLRVGIPAEFFEVEGLRDDVREAIEKVADTFRALGAETVPVHLPHTKYAIAAYYIIATAEASANLARFDGIRYGFRDPRAETLLETYRMSRAGGFGREVKRRIILGTYVLSSGYHDAYYNRAQKVRTLIRQDYDTAFESCDVLLSPASPFPAFRAGEITDPLQMYLADIYTISANLAGNCGISVPCAFSAEGLPIGAQLLGPSLGESAVLRAAHLYEQNADFDADFSAGPVLAAVEQGLNHEI